jgi:hypothetical protein
MNDDPTKCCYCEGEIITEEMCNLPDGKTGDAATVIFLIDSEGSPTGMVCPPCADQHETDEGVVFFDLIMTRVDSGEDGRLMTSDGQVCKIKEDYRRRGKRGPEK